MGDQSSIKLEFMQEINKIREQVNSDIHAVNLRVIDIGKTTGLKLENIVPQVNDLQHMAEACALEVQSMRKNMPARVIEDSKSWLGKLDDLDKKMQLNLSKTTSKICNLEAKLDMNSILVSQLFEERAGVFKQSDEVRSNNISSRGFSPVREPSLSREFSTPLPASVVPSRTATPMSTAPSTPQFRLLSSVPGFANVAPSTSRLVPSSPGAFSRSTRGAS